MHTSLWRHPQFVLDDVHVTADAVLGEVGRGLEITMEWFVDERLMIAARCVGAATRALELAADFARTRSTFGRPLDDNQMIQAMLADSALDIALCRSFTYEVAWHADREADRKLLHAKAAIAKLASSEAAGRVVDRAVQIFGGRGYMRENPVERLYRDVRADRIWEGTSEVQRMIIANEVRKRGVEGLVGAAAASASARSGPAA